MDSSQSQAEIEAEAYAEHMFSFADCDGQGSARARSCRTSTSTTATAHEEDGRHGSRKSRGRPLPGAVRPASIDVNTFGTNSRSDSRSKSRGSGRRLTAPLSFSNADCGDTGGFARAPGKAGQGDHFCHRFNTFDHEEEYYPPHQPHNQQHPQHWHRCVIPTPASTSHTRSTSFFSSWSTASANAPREHGAMTVSAAGNLVEARASATTMGPSPSGSSFCGSTSFASGGMVYPYPTPFSLHHTPVSSTSEFALKKSYSLHRYPDVSPASMTSFAIGGMVHAYPTPFTLHHTPREASWDFREVTPSSKNSVSLPHGGHLQHPDPSPASCATAVDAFGDVRPGGRVRLDMATLGDETQKKVVALAGEDEETPGGLFLVAGVAAPAVVVDDAAAGKEIEAAALAAARMTDSLVAETAARTDEATGLKGEVSAATVVEYEVAAAPAARAEPKVVDRKNRPETGSNPRPRPPVRPLAAAPAADATVATSHREERHSGEWQGKDQKSKEQQLQRKPHPAHSKKNNTLRQQRGVTFASVYPRRRPYNPYRVEPRESPSPQPLDGVRLWQTRGHHPRRQGAENEHGVGRSRDDDDSQSRGERASSEKYFGEHSGLDQSLPSSSGSAFPSSEATTSSSTGGTSGGAFTPAWIWPDKGVSSRPPHLAGRCRRHTEFCRKTPAVDVVDSPSCASPPPSLSFSRPSRLSAGTPPGNARKEKYFASGSIGGRRYTTGGFVKGGSVGADDGWTTAAGSDIADDSSSRSAVADGGAAAMGAAGAGAAAQWLTADIVEGMEGNPGEDRAVLSHRATHSSRAHAESAKVSTASSSPLVSTTAEGRYGASATAASVALARARARTRAPLSSPSIPSASAGGEESFADVQHSGEVFDLPPLRVTSEAFTAMREPGAAFDGSGGGGDDESCDNASRVRQQESMPGTVEPAVRPQRGEGWWSFVRSWFDRREQTSPLPTPLTSPMKQKQSDWSILNPFSPASSRRFSTASADAGAGGRHGDDGGGAVVAAASSAASRFSTRVLQPMSGFKLEEHLVGCVFGGSSTPRDGQVVEATPHAGQLARGVEEEEDQAGKRRLAESLLEKNSSRHSTASPYSIYYSTPTYTLPESTNWSLPSATAAEEDTKPNVTVFHSDGGTSFATTATMTSTATALSSTAGVEGAAGGVEQTLREAEAAAEAAVGGTAAAEGPNASRGSSSRPWSAPPSLSTPPSSSACPGAVVADAATGGGGSVAITAIAAAALVGHASVATNGAAAAARQARDAFRRAASVDA